MKKALIIGMVVVLLLIMIVPFGTAMAKWTPPTHVAEETPEYYLAAHAVVVKDGMEETAWADCNNSQQFPGKNWAWYFSYPGNEGEGMPMGYEYDNAWGLYAGKNTLMGWVIVEITDGVMEITFLAQGGWMLAETHLAVVTAAEGWQAIPQTKSGNPKVGQFVGLDGEKSGIQFDPPVETFTYIYNIP